MRKIVGRSFGIPGTMPAAACIALAALAPAAAVAQQPGSPAASTSSCPMTRAGTRTVCRMPEDTCDSGLLTSYAACIGDTASEGHPGILAESFRSTILGGQYRLRFGQCPIEITVFRCSCTPLGDYCAPGSACKRTAVVAGTVVPPDVVSMGVQCAPTVFDPPIPPGPLS